MFLGRSWSNENNIRNVICNIITSLYTYKQYMDKMLLATFDQLRPSSNVAREKITENVCVVGGPKYTQIRMVHCHGFTVLFLYLASGIFHTKKIPDDS